MSSPIRAALCVGLAVLVIACRAHEGEPCKPGDCEKHLSCESGTCRVCREASDCADFGKCTWDEEAEQCSPSSEMDCRQSRACWQHGYCYLYDSQCLKSRPGDENVKEGGCPCGCDHSEELVDELRGMDREQALAGAWRSIATIGEREQLGYVTEAMLTHRLRLRTLEEELLGPGASRYEVPLSANALALRAARAKREPRTADGLSVRSELLVFGATTETLHGKPKPLRACFRLWLELSDESGSGRTIERPALRGDRGVELDVKRWYLEDSDGNPWDGELEGGETRSVLVVGYLQQQLPPGVPVTIRGKLGAVVIEESHVALGRWDAHLETLR